MLRRFHPVGFALLLLVAPGLRAAVIYTYTGNPFTNASSQWLTGAFTLATALPANTPLTDFASDVLAVNFSDTQRTINTINTSLDVFEFATSGGVITQWDINLFDSTASTEIFTIKMAPYTPSSQYYEDLGEGCPSACTGSNYYYIRYNYADGGTFSGQTSIVPEPSSFGTAFVAIMAIAAVLRRRGTVSFAR
jgi:hypothetical protein